MTISSIYNAALLAHAVYADGLDPNDTGSVLSNRLVDQNLNAGGSGVANGMTSAQADYIGDNYRVIYQQATTPNGFSATLFQDINTNEYIISMRGTDDGFYAGVDWTGANNDNIFSGVSRAQVADMVNFYIKLVSPPNSPINQYFYDTHTGHFELGGSALGLGRITSATDLTVVGHSLGGHLASVFTLLFSEVSAQTYTFDSAGFIARLGTNTFPAYSQEIASVVTELSINPVTEASLGQVTDVAAPLDPVSRGGQHLGTSVEVFIEADLEDLLENHSVDRLVDSLAVMNFMSVVDPTMTIDIANQLFESTDNKMSSSLASVMNYFAGLYQQPKASLTDKNDSIYRLIETLTPLIEDNPNTLRIFDTSSLSNRLTSDDAYGLAYRYAILNLSPFAIAGEASLYTPHNTNGELNYDSYSEQFWQDRAAMLESLIVRNASDISDSVLPPSPTNTYTLYEDLTTGRSFVEASQQDKVITFGTDGDDVVTKGSLDNNIYGMGGNDTLHGGGGRDHLEGNTGNDTLYGGGDTDYLYGGAGDDHLYGGAGTDFLDGGDGNDIYYFNSGDGADQIRDIDAGDRIVINGNLISNVEQLFSDAENTYQDDFGNTYLINSSGELMIIVGGDSTNGTLTVTNFNRTTNNFGIMFIEAEAPAPFAPPPGMFDAGNGEIVNEWGQTVELYASFELRGNLALGQAFINEAGVSALIPDLTELWLDYENGIDQYGNDGLQLNEAGELLAFSFDGSDKVDYLIGGAQGEALVGHDMDDHIEGNGGFDVIQGGMGSDFITGGDGNDELWGNYADKLSNGQVSSFYDDEGADGADFIDGGAGDDKISGDEGDDQILGGLDDDLVYGGAGSDIISGGMGDDRIKGDSRLEHDGFIVDGDYLQSIEIEDRILSAEQDVEYGDTISGGAGEDWIYGELGDDIISGGADRDYIWGDRKDLEGVLHGADTLSGDDGDDQIIGGGANDIIFGGAGNDLLHGDEDLYDGEASIVLEGQYHGDDIIHTGDGFNTVYAGGADDIVFGGADADLIFGDSSYELETVEMLSVAVSLTRMGSNSLAEVWHGEDLLYGGGGGDFIYGGGGNDAIYGEDGVDTLSGNTGDDFIDGGAESDWIFGDDGNDTLLGGSGNFGDAIFGGAGDDLITGGMGNDVLVGGEGNDTYYMRMGDGIDQIDDAHGENILEVSGLDSSDLRLNFTNDHTYLILDGTASTAVQFSAQSLPHFSIFDSRIGGGQSIDIQSIRQSHDYRTSSVGSTGAIVTNIVSGEAADTVYTSYLNTYVDLGGGDDFLYADGGNDTIIGGRGDDYLSGWYGSDTYLFQAGDGRDIISDMSDLDPGTPDDNGIQLGAGYSALSTALEQDGNDLIIRNGLGDEIKVLNYFLNVAYEIDSIEFEDATLVSVGSGRDETLTGSIHDDKIVGFGGNDTLVGSLGNDLLMGGAGNDTYVYNLGDGHDIISDVSGPSRLRLGAGIGLSDLIMSDEPEGLRLSIRQGAVIVGSVTFAYPVTGAPVSVLESIRLENGTVLSGAGFGAIYNGIIAPSPYSEDSILVPIFSSLSYEYALPPDTFFNDNPSTDIYTATLADGSPLPSWLSFDSSRLSFNIVGTDPETQAVDVIVTVLTLDGLTATQVFHLQSPPVVVGSDNDDYLYSAEHSVGSIEIHGADGYDTIYGSDDVDLLYGGGGGDYIYGYGGNDLIWGGDDNDRLFGGLGIDWLNGGDGDDFLYGGEGNDVLISAGGEDLLFGENGDDLLIGNGLSLYTDLYGGNGDDRFVLYGGEYADGGLGTDVIEIVSLSADTYISVDFEVSTLDIVRLPDGLSISGLRVSRLEGWSHDIQSALLHFQGMEETLWIGGAFTWQGDGYFGMGGNGTSDLRILFADGSVLTTADLDFMSRRGTEFDDYLSAGHGYNNGLGGNDRLEGGHPSDDVLAGGAGDDLLRGNGGSDTYIFTSGVDTIGEWAGQYTGDEDLLILDVDKEIDEVWFSRQDNHMIINILGTTDKVWIANGFQGYSGLTPSPDTGVEFIRLGDKLISFSDAAEIMDVMRYYSMPSNSINEISDSYVRQMILGMLPSRWIDAPLENRTPLVHLGMSEARTLSNLAFTQAIPVDTFYDLDGDALTFSVSTLPDWLSFDGSNFNGTPTSDDLGVTSITITASDGMSSVSTDFQITVMDSGVDNHAPNLEQGLPSISAPEDAPFSFSIPDNAFADLDGDALIYSAGTLPAWLTFNGTTFSGIPTNANVGSTTITVTASDGLASVSTNFTLTVTNTNDAPVLSLAPADQSVNERQALSFGIPDGSFTDVDAGDSLLFSASLADGSPLPTWLTFNAATQTFTGTPGAVDIGTLSLRVTATDAAGASVSDVFDVTILNVNDAPVVDQGIANTNVAEDATFSLVIPANAFSDLDGDTLIYSTGTLPGWLTFNGTTFSGTPTNANVGSTTITVTASDGLASVSSDFMLSVINTNNAPVVSLALADQSVNEREMLSFGIPAGSFTDVDIADSLTCSATLADGSPLPTWLSFNVATQTFSGTPGAVDIGTLSLRVTATDAAGASVSDVFDVTILNVNDAPVVDQGIANNSAAEDAAFTLTIPSNAFADLDGDALTYIVGTLPGWLTFNGTTFSGTPTNSDVGSTAITVTASDGELTVSSDFTVTVTNTNDAPVASIALANQSGTEGSLLSFGIPAGSFTDVDAGDSLSYSASRADGSQLPAWLTFDAETRVFSGTPGENDVGMLLLRVMATDLAGLSAYTTFTVIVDGSDSYDFTLEGTSRSNILTGTEGRDLLDGLGGNDTIYGQDGNDTIIGGAGNDTLYGGAGDDTFVVEGTGQGSDRVYGDAGFDSIVGGVGNDTITLSRFDLDSSIERIDGGAGINILAGTTSSNVLDFSATTLVGIAHIDGGAGNDTITGSVGNDRIIGGAGNDTLYGGDGNDEFVVEGSGQGSDTIYGGAGFDSIVGGAGDDTITLVRFDLASSIERIDGGVGINILAGTTSSNVLDFSATTLIGIAHIDGGAGNDTITGSVGNDRMIGGAGNDTLYGGDGNDEFVVEGSAQGSDTVYGGAGFDSIVGGAGNDTITLTRFDLASSIERIDGGAGINILAGTTGGNTLDFSATALLGFAHIDGGSGNDVITGSSGDDIILGGAGRDTLHGGVGNDQLTGGLGNDTLSGGDGSDTYFFGTGDGADIINNYDTNSDSTDIARFDGVAVDDLWFNRSGNNLVVTLAGTVDRVTISNWYTNADYQLDRIEVGSSYLLNSQVDQLVSAMSSFGVPSGAGNVISQEVKDQLQPVLAASWQAA